MGFGFQFLLRNPGILLGNPPKITNYALPDSISSYNFFFNCCGVFFTADGGIADIPLNGCTPCAKPNEMPSTDMTLLAGGLSKSVATLAVLRANFIDRLFVDENLARKLLENC